MEDGKIKQSFFAKPKYLNCSGRLLNISEPVIAGILNITPDSFYDGGKYKSESEIIAQAIRFYEEGAAIIDIGAYSSRPGAEHVSSEEEWKRLTRVLRYIKAEVPQLFISVDTFRSEIAYNAKQEFDISIVNDISGGEMDAKMFETVANIKTAYILMHMQGTPQTMQNNPNYASVIDEIVQYFQKKVHQLKALGVADIILDPGFGFGKTLDHNYNLLNKLNHFKIFELPLMVGLSRKSMIQKVIKTDASQSQNGTTVLNTIALMQGANIVRVHDVKEARETIALIKMLEKNSN